MAANWESQVEVGSVIAEKYLVEKILGRGGMGMVVAARHTGLRELRAIKFMLPHVARDRMAVERFRREARAASRLRSEHVVKVYDIDRLEGGALYIVMEHLEGQDLKSLARARGILPLTEACDYVLQACEAIEEAHASGIIHRDLKTSNLFLTTGPRREPLIKVLDFGVAKLASQIGSSLQEITETKLSLGSPAFMAPEQMRSSRQSDARADIWALGVILYKLTTGLFPFEAPSINEMAARILSAEHARKPSTLNPTLPPLFDQIVRVCLEKDREQRFASASELAKGLRALVERHVDKQASGIVDDADLPTLEFPRRVVTGARAPLVASAENKGGSGAPSKVVSAVPLSNASRRTTTFLTPPEKLAIYDLFDADDTTTPPMPKRVSHDAPVPTPLASPPQRRRPRLASAPTMPDTRFALLRRGIAPRFEESDVPLTSANVPMSVENGAQGARSEVVAGRDNEAKSGGRAPTASIRSHAAAGLLGAIVGAIGLWLALAAGACASPPGAQPNPATPGDIH